MNFNQILLEETKITTPLILAKAILRGQVPGVSAKAFFDDRYEDVKRAVETNNNKTMPIINLNVIIQLSKQFDESIRNAVMFLYLKKLKNFRDITTRSYGNTRVIDALHAYFRYRNKAKAKEKIKYFEDKITLDEIKTGDWEHDIIEIFKDKAVGKEDADKLYEDDTWLMVIPKTYAASCKYGENTKWCTTGSKERFESYSMMSPLLIIINKKTNKKYQAHRQSGNFMDEKNEEPENIEQVVISFPEKIQQLLVKYNFNIWNKLLKNASKSGDLQQVKQALIKGANIHANDDDALCQASNYGHTEIIKLLLDKGANVHANDDAALCRASLNGHTKIVKLLLDKGANIHADNDYALRYASNYGHTEIIKLLLDKGANIHADNDFALRWASLNGHTEVVKLLLDKGADIHVNNDGALRYASNYGHTEIIKLLLDKGADIHADNDGALRWAIQEGNIEVVKLLLDRGATVRKEALYWATDKGYTEIIKLLKQHMKKEKK